MANSPERLVVKGHFDDICSSVTDPDVTTFAGELLQDDLISEAGYSATIAVTGLPPRDKLGNLLSEVMGKVSCSQNKFYKFVAILETRNSELASALKSDHKLRQDSQHLPRNVITEEDQNQETPPFSKKRKEHDPCAEYETHIQLAVSSTLTSAYGSRLQETGAEERTQDLLTQETSTPIFKPQKNTSSLWRM